MKKIMLICGGALLLAGCNTTIQSVPYSTQRIVYSPAPVYGPLPPRRPYCYTIERRSPYGVYYDRVCR